MDAGGHDRGADESTRVGQACRALEVRRFLDLHAESARPDAVELRHRNIASGLYGNVPVYSVDPQDFTERIAWLSLQNWPRLKYWDDSQVIVLATGGMSGDRGDANITLTSDDAPTQYMRSTLTANRTWTISGEFQNGDYFEIVRNPAATGAFTLAVVDGATSTTLVTIPASTKARVRVGFDGTGWFLVGYGTLP